MRALFRQLFVPALLVGAVTAWWFQVPSWKVFLGTLAVIFFAEQMCPARREWNYGRGVQAVQRDDSATGSYLLESTLGDDRRELIARTAVEEGWGLLELARLDVSLEEVFARLTGERGGADGERTA